MNARTIGVLAASAAVAGLVGIAGNSAAGKPHGGTLTFADDSGIQQTISTAGRIDTGNPFFQDLGTNGRTCVTCHRPAEGWTVTPDELRDRFDRTRGLDPIFRSNDGSTCEGADISTLGKRRAAFSLLLHKGLIRVGMPIPAGAEFSIVDIDDPYHCGAPFSEASMYRRPLPSTNLGFLSTVMWDGRETSASRSMRENLISQAFDATMGHAQGAPPSRAQVEAIADFEMSLFTAQTHDRGAGSLTRDSDAGPQMLSTQPFCIGINDPLNLLPSVPGACASSSGGLNPEVFTLFDGWQRDHNPARSAIARGEQIFNTRTFVIDNVAGLNGAPNDPVAGPIQSGTCTVCHDTPNAGNHSISMALNIGVSDAAQRTPDLPLYTLQNATTHETVQTTDPGRAMVTGKWADIGKFKGPILRALSARAPYFHNGSAATLEQAVEFYDTRFHIHLSAREKADLVAFLRAL